MQAGCSFPVERIVIADCKERMLGGYVGINSLGLLICYNNYPGVPEVLRSTLVHELVHAYDECRVKKLDWLNCKHLACSEVRLQWQRHLDQPVHFEIRHCRCSLDFCVQ
jgi:inner membrane protease ATP23